MRHSYTKIKMYMECPAKKRYKYDERIPVERNAAAQRGVDYHASIEQAIGGSEAPLADGLDFYSGYLQRLRSLGAQAEFQWAVSRDWTHVGWDSEDAWLIGVADVWLPSVPTAHVQDWKTGKIYDDHHMQGEFYTIPMFTSNPEIQQVKATFIYTDLRKERTRNYTRHELEDLKRRWKARIDRMENDTECVPTPSMSCRWCPFSKAKGGPCRF